MQKTIHLFRHGTPEEALQGRCRGGDTHCDLSPEGMQQTRGNIAYLLSYLEPSEMHVVTSSMERSDFFGRELAMHGVPHTVDKRFRTIGAGDWEGLSWEEIKLRWPEQFEIASSRAQHLEMPNGEPVSHFQSRVRAAFRNCLNLPPRNIVIVGHGCTNEVILADAEKREDLNFRNQPIACMNRIDVDEKGAMHVQEKKATVYIQYV
ncbi:MAG TPA: histidine phosphatase family protein [Candidatus Peribacteraceae bacterium]|nr:histidine phosphatase family protein [Candidatus Peribacteraceae bacterium]